jgi:hypothetical protein
VSNDANQNISAGQDPVSLAPHQAETQAEPNRNGKRAGETAAAWMERLNREHDLKVEIAAREITEKAGAARAIELQSTRDKDVRLLISPDVESPKKWRVTRFDAVGPSGHHVFPTQEVAVRAASGDSFSDHVPGPSYYQAGEFAFKAARSPRPVGVEPSDKQTDRETAQMAALASVGVARVCASPHGGP